jgi:hypothetical protein
MVVPRNKSTSTGDEAKRTPWHCVVGKIHYENVDPGAEPGIFVYVKASLTGDEPADVLNYQTAHPDFPHETTADQWFDEPQFESYRRLGQHIVKRMFTDEKSEEEFQPHEGLAGAFQWLQNHWGAKWANAKLKNEAHQKEGKD